jgi:transposase
MEKIISRAHKMAKVRKKVTKLPEKRKVGRPTKYEPEFCERVVEFMAKGYSKEAVAGELWITKDTLYEWEKRYPEFSDALKQGVELSRKFWEKTAIDNIVYSQKGRKADAVLWIFNMKNRFGWSDKKEIELGEKTAKKFAFALDVAPELIDEKNSDEGEAEEGDGTT